LIRFQADKVFINELYGEWLLAINKPKEALEQFEQSLETAPGRILSMQGKDRAIKLLKN
jgi:predicted negative regulator of RcsB-dependent stress response